MAPIGDYKNPYLAVAGNIGCGKSTLVEVLGEHYGVRPLYEPNEANPYLKDFYADMRAHAFKSQMWFLAQKFRMHQSLDRMNEAVIQDRTVWEDAEIFAAGLHRSRFISNRDWALYDEFYAGIQEAIRPPDVLFYLHAPVRVIRQRIRQRGRPEEQQISPRYLRQLNQRYENFIDGWKSCPVKVIDTTKLRYLDDLWDRQMMLEMVGDYLQPKE
ncbi:MAG: deoxynucleoside kinase [Myxococcota bacterium]|nr:deoxynucleoside kinase [Myxococcota bacterium]